VHACFVNAQEAQI